jgi:hypothetical protein
MRLVLYTLRDLNVYKGGMLHGPFDHPSMLHLFDTLGEFSGQKTQLYNTCLILRIMYACASSGNETEIGPHKSSPVVFQICMPMLVRIGPKDSRTYSNNGQIPPMVRPPCRLATNPVCAPLIAPPPPPPPPHGGVAKEHSP